MRRNNEEDNSKYYILDSDVMMDISSGTPVAANEETGDEDKQHYSDGFSTKEKNNKPERYKKSSDNPGKKKKIIIISSIAAAVVIALGVTGFVIFNSFNKQINASADEQEFIFNDKTIVSGIDITGKNMEQAKLLLEKNKDKFITPITLSIGVNGETVKLTQSDFSYEFNIEDVLKRAKHDYESGQKPTEDVDGAITYTVTAKVKEESINSNVGKICKDTDTEPKNAYVTDFKPYSDDRFEFAEAQDGCKVDSDDLKQKISTVFVRGESVSTIEAKVEKESADVNAEELSKKLVKLSSYETYSTNTANGTSNMKVSLEACNGSIIDPGEVWSFNGCTGDSNLESNGYKSAHVISDGKLIDGIGGGICQSSSTIYNAAVRANMEIEERYNHKWASNYVPTGLDATIDYPNLDLKLSNPTDFQMFLECKVVGSTLYASFWGVKSGNYDEIHTHNEVSDTGSKSYSVRAWRVYIKDGKEIDREELSKSTYDNDYGVVFIEADNDTRAEDKDVDGLDDSSSSNAESSSLETSDSYRTPSSSSNSSSHTSSSSTPSSKPTEAPSSSHTENPGTEPPVQTDPPVSSEDSVPSES